MADTVTSNVLFNLPSRYVIELTNVSDGTGESAVIKVDRSTLIGPTGAIPTSLVVEEIQWSIQGFSSVKLYWDHSSDSTIAILAAGNGYVSFKDFTGLVDPTSNASASDGDILLTTAGAVSGATYTITIVFRLKA